MDSKTWGTLGGSSTRSSRNLQALSQQQQQQQQFSSTSAANVYASTGRSAIAAHWQRIACINAATANGVAPTQNQLQQQQQAPQLRFFQVPKQFASQYPATQVPGTAGCHQQHQQHYSPQHYAIITSNNSIFPERSNPHKREAAQYSYFITPLVQKSTTLTQTLTLRTLDEEVYQVHLGLNQPFYRQRCQILTNGHSVNPGEMSLTTCFALSANIEGLYVTPMSTIVDPPQPGITAVLSQSTNPTFINVIEAVPDMLRDVRPGGTTIVRPIWTPFFYNQEEFSYHADKLRLPLRFRDETSKAKQWAAVTIRQPTVVEIGTGVCENRMDVRHPDASASTSIGNVLPTRGSRTISTDWRTNGSPEEIQPEASAPGQKTYADVVQETGRQDCSPKSGGRTIKDYILSKPVIKCKVYDTKRMERNGLESKVRIFSRSETREPREDENDADGEFRTMWRGMDISERSLNQTSRSRAAFENSVMSLRRASGNTKSKGGTSVNAAELARKRMCKMAESFCLEHLGSEAFFVLFNEYAKHQRRMTYTSSFSSIVE